VYDDRPDMSVPARQALTADDLGTARFGVGLRGYRMDEVDTLLERVAREVAERDRRIADLERAVTPIVHGPEGAGFASRHSWDPADFDDTGYQKPIMVGGEFPEPPTAASAEPGPAPAADTAAMPTAEPAQSADAAPATEAPATEAAPAPAEESAEAPAAQEPVQASEPAQQPQAEAESAPQPEAEAASALRPEAEVESALRPEAEVESAPRPEAEAQPQAQSAGEETAARSTDESEAAEQAQQQAAPVVDDLTQPPVHLPPPPLIQSLLEEARQQAGDAEPEPWFQAKEPPPDHSASAESPSAPEGNGQAPETGGEEGPARGRHSAAPDANVAQRPN
jgi:DivIVA domain-containing protein